MPGLQDARQYVAQSDLVRRSRPGTKLARFGPAVDNAAGLILNRQRAELGAPPIGNRLTFGSAKRSVSQSTSSVTSGRRRRRRKLAPSVRPASVLAINPQCITHSSNRPRTESHCCAGLAPGAPIFSARPKLKSAWLTQYSSSCANQKFIARPPMLRYAARDKPEHRCAIRQPFASP